MSDKELMEGNKIIAKFLGYEYVPYNQPMIDEYYVFGPEKEKTFHTKELVGWINKAPVYNLKGRESVGPPYVLCRNAKQLPFHENWNWVMRIVEEIEEKYAHIRIFPTHTYCMIEQYAPSLECTYMKCEKENKLLSTWAACVEVLKMI